MAAGGSVVGRVSGSLPVRVRSHGVVRLSEAGQRPSNRKKLPEKYGRGKSFGCGWISALSMKGWFKISPSAQSYSSTFFVDKEIARFV
jgi:hypothetical protein